MTDRDGWGWTAETADLPQDPSADEDRTPVTRDHARDTRVREDSTLTSDESELSDCDSADAAAEPSAVTEGDRRGWFWARFHRPDIFENRPGLSQLAAYAYRGAGAPADGPLRTGSIWWYRLVAFPITAWAYQKAWALERPFRGWPVLIVQIGWLALNIATLVHFL